MGRIDNVRALEGLKDKIFRTFNSWTDGLGPEEHPITTDVAIAQIWEHVQTFAIDTKRMPKVAWLRVSVAPDENGSVDEDTFMQTIEHMPIVTLRRIGPRVLGHAAVYYLTVSAKTATAAYNYVLHLNSSGFAVTDFTYGC